MNPGLTPQMKVCLSAVERLSAGGSSPTLDELGAEMGGMAKSNVQRLLTRLKERRYVDWIPRKARSISIVRPSIAPADLDKISTDDLLQIAAHIAGILAYRQGSKLTSDAFARIAARIARLPVRAFLEAG